MWSRTTWLIGLLAAAWIYMYSEVHDRMHATPFCQNQRNDPRCFFSESYLEARKRFIDETSKLTQQDSPYEIEIRHQPLPEFPDLYIDFVLIRKALSTAAAQSDESLSARKFLVHSSGTHGVEGFVGSAIQSAALESIRNGSVTIPDGITVIFIHAVNPYGFATFRRVNEHNVDLNRNGVQDWSTVHPPAKPDLSELFLVPRGAPGYGLAYVSFWMQAAWNVVMHGTCAVIRAAVVPGQYIWPRGMFYGGSRTEPSLSLINEIVFEEFGVKDGDVLWIDVHTGLGSFGSETLMLQEGFEGAVVEKVFKDKTVDHPGKNIQETEWQGYEDLQGTMNNWLRSKIAKGKSNIFITEEFGTHSVINNFVALYSENAAFQFDKDIQPFYASTYLKRAFDPLSAKWRAKTLLQGIDLFNKSLIHIEQILAPKKQQP